MSKEMNNNSKFKHFMQQIHENSERLAVMINEDIPESLPSVENTNGNDHNFNHHNTDFPGIFNFPSRLPDSLAPELVIEELEEIILFTRIVIEDLYPKNLVSGDMVLEVDSQFSALKQSLDSFLTQLAEFKMEVTSMRSTHATDTIDLKALRELKLKLTRIGLEYVEKGYKLPIEFQDNEENIVHNIKEIERINASLPPQIEQFRMDNNNNSNYSRFTRNNSNNSNNLLDFSNFLK